MEKNSDSSLLKRVQVLGKKHKKMKHVPTQPTEEQKTKFARALKIFKIKRRRRRLNYNIRRKVQKADVARETQRDYCLELRKRGWSLKEIGKETGISLKTVGKYVVDAIAALKCAQWESAEHIQKMELLRLDLMLKKIGKQIDKGNLFAVDRALKIMERRAKYIPGLEVPGKYHFGNDPESPLFEAAVSLEDKLKRLAAQDPEMMEKVKDSKFANGSHKPESYKTAPPLDMEALGVEEEAEEEE